MNELETQNSQGEEPTLLPVATTPEAAAMLQAFDGPSYLMRTNLPLNEAWAKTWLLKTGGLSDFRLEKLKDEKFDISYFHMKVVPVLLSKTGELQLRVMVTLFNPDGKTLAWTSAITTSKFALFLQAHGKGPWEPAIPVFIRGVPGKETGHWYYFEGPQLPKPKAKGK